MAGSSGKQKVRDWTSGGEYADIYESSLEQENVVTKYSSAVPIHRTKQQNSFSIRK